MIKIYECYVEKVENLYIFEFYCIWRFFNCVCIYGCVCLCVLRGINCISYLVINIDYENILYLIIFICY